MHLEQPRSRDGGIDWRYTFLRWHVAGQIGQSERLDVLAVEELLQQIEQHGLAVRSDPEVRRWLSRRQFFYRTLADQRLCIRARVADGYRPRATEREQYAESRRRHQEECRRALAEGKKPPVRTDFDVTCYDDLTALILAMHGRLHAQREPDRRGIVLLARSGVGKTVACRRAFYDCFFSTPDDEAEHDAPPQLAGFLPGIHIEPN